MLAEDAPLHRHLAARVGAWREQGYPCDRPEVGEILRWAAGERHLRAAQLAALETYWYLRIVLATPHTASLHRTLYPDPRTLASVWKLPAEVAAQPPDAWRRALEDAPDRWRQQDALRESLGMGYPSYVLALAMGAGKTLLIGAIVATEFALADLHPAGGFVRNALVFAPGKTVIESLRELTRARYDRILPPRLYRRFAASVKITLPRDGDDELPVVHRSSFNVVVTNSEKIRIQQRSAPRSPWSVGADAAGEVVNRRLQALATLPGLALFADEAHHAYGQSLAQELKKIRKTVDYLAAATDLVCVVNTTGTPYARRELLPDVVFWYGLREAIEDGVLKSVAGNIHAFDRGGEPAAVVAHVVEDFLRIYGEVRLADGAHAKLAIYFPQTHDLAELRPVVERTLQRFGHGPATCITNTSDPRLTSAADLDAFRRLRDPAAPQRVILLVNKGTEGWDCPSLFACALVRDLDDAHNFVLQAATRCLRQVPGNAHPARIYLSAKNLAILERQLRATYGESVRDLAQVSPRCERIPRLHPPAPPVARARPAHVPARAYRVDSLRRPGALSGTIAAIAYDLDRSGALRAVARTETSAASEASAGRYAAAVELAARYRLDLWVLLDELWRLYGTDPIPLRDLDPLARQIEGLTEAETIQPSAAGAAS